MYRIFVSLLAGLVFFGFTACDSSNEEDSRVAQQVQENKSKVSSHIIEKNVETTRINSPIVGEEDLSPSIFSTSPTSPAFVEGAFPAESDGYGKVALSFAAEITRCGIQVSKSNCLISAMRVIDSGEAELSNGRLTFSVLAHDITGARLGLVVESDGEKPLAQIRSAKLVTVGPKTDRAELLKNDYLFNRSRTILSINIAHDSVAHAQHILGQEDRDYREYFYAIEYLMFYSPGHRFLVVDAINKHYELIASATEATASMYQTALLKNMRIKLPGEPALLQKVAYRFLNLPDVKIQQYAAVTLALLGEKGEKVHSKVIAVVENQHSLLLALAIEALNRIREGIDDENLILGHFANRDEALNNLLSRLIADWTLLDGHIPALLKLANHASYPVRKRAVNLVQRIPTHAAVKLLARLLSDRDSDVHEASFNALKTRALTIEDLPALTEVLKRSTSWGHRRAAIQLIATIAGDDAAHVLISSLNDHDSDVRQAGILALTHYTLSNSALPFLQPLLRAPGWEIRRSAVNLTATIGTSEALANIIPLTADSDQDVRNTVKTVMANLRLTNNEIPLLKNLLTKPAWEARRQAVVFIATIGSREAAEAIISALGDSDTDVRKAALAALKSLPCDAAMVPEFRKVATNRSYEARMSVAEMLARVKDESATGILLALVFDNDSDVQRVALNAIIGHPFSAEQIDSLESSLNTSSYSIRLRAAKMLGLSGACRTIPWLKKRQAQENDADVSAAIAAALRQLAICQ